MFLDGVVCILIFYLGFQTKNLFSGFSRLDRRILNKLYFFHICLGIAYVFFNLSGNGGDAIIYWSYPKMLGWDSVIEKVLQGSPTGYMFLLNYFPSNVLELSFFTVSMLYTMLGYVAFIFLFKIIKENIPNIKVLERRKLFGVPLFPYMLFLPNIHFWSSGLGKDTVLFFSIAVFFYSIHAPRRRFILFLVSVIGSVFIRPHILLFLITSVGIAILIDARIKSYYKAVLYLVLITGLILIIPKVMQVTQVENLQTSSLENFASSNAEKLNSVDSGSGIDIASYPYIYKIFTFLYRPLFYDVNGILAVFSSIENLVILLFSVMLARNQLFYSFKKGNLTIKSLFFFFLIGTLVFPLILGNLGIIQRQKAPFIIIFIIFGFWIMCNSTVRTSKYKII